MAQIYAGATHVVWLGDAVDNSDLALEEIRIDSDGQNRDNTADE